MTNVEKYKTVEARTEAFDKFCESHTVCALCELKRERTTESAKMTECVFLWLDKSAEPSIAEMVATLRKKMMERAGYTEEGWKALCDNLDAAVKRAYERIDREMRGNFHSDSTDVALMRSVMDEVIGGYRAQEGGTK